MSSGMKDQRAVYVTELCDSFQIEVHRAVGVDGEQPTVRCCIPVFLYDLQGQVQ